MPKPSFHVPLVLALLTAWYLAATLPYLADFPLLDWPQMGIVAPAAKLAEEGVYGNDLFADFHRSEARNYEYMPAYPLLVALSFELFGLGVAQARLVSVFFGWLTVMLTFALGRRFFGTGVGLVSASLLCFLKLGLLPGTSGVTLLDYARVIRYDILVPVGVLASTIYFLWAEQASGRRRTVGRILAGLLIGLATLAHVYAALMLPLFAAALLWHRGWRTLREPTLYLVAAGWLLAMMPWIVYVAQDFDAYQGQMSRHGARFDLLDPAFYWHNLVHEPGRYGPWLKGGFPGTFLQPRAGIWLLLLGLPVAMALLWRRIRDDDRSDRLADRLLLLSLPVLELGLALFIFMKRPVYVLLLLPFLTLWLGLAAIATWRRAEGRPAWRVVFVVAASLVLLEGGTGVARNLATASEAPSYLDHGREIARSIPDGSRLLITQHLWLGLEASGDYDLRSIHLVFLYLESATVDEVMDQLAPDYVVIEGFLLEEQSGDRPGPRPGSFEERTFLAIGGYLERHCTEVTEVPDPAYGPIRIYHCR